MSLEQLTTFDAIKQPLEDTQKVAFNVSTAQKASDQKHFSWRIRWHSLARPMPNQLSSQLSNQVFPYSEYPFGV